MQVSKSSPLTYGSVELILKRFPNYDAATLENCFNLPSSADHDEMLSSVAFHWGIHCSSKISVQGLPKERYNKSDASVTSGCLDFKIPRETGLLSEL